VAAGGLTSEWILQNATADLQLFFAFSILRGSRFLAELLATMSDRDTQTLAQRVVSGITVARICSKSGDLLAKILTFVLQLFFMVGLTFYAAANSAQVDGLDLTVPAGGIVFLYSIAIGASWVIILLLVQLVDDRNIVLAGKAPLTLVIMACLVFVFLGVTIGAIVFAGEVRVPGGTLVGYFFLTWIVTELVVAASVVVQMKFGRKPRSIGDEYEGEDEYAESRGTFQGIDEETALSPTKKATTEGTDASMDLQGVESEQPVDDDDDLGLL